MIHSLAILLQDSYLLAVLTTLVASCAAVALAKIDDESDDDDANFNFSADALREYQELVAETDARIAELADQLDSDDCDNRGEALEELAQCYLQNAARAQEEGDSERAADYYAAAFARFEELLEEFGEERDILRNFAAGQLNYAILLNDDGEIDAADDAYLAAQKTTQKLVDMGDQEALLDRAGIKLNRASLAFERDERDKSFQMLDETAQEFQAFIAGPMSQNPEAYYYLAKTYMTKASFLLSILHDPKMTSPEAVEARELITRGIEAFRTLVNAGHTQYKRELADALVSVVEAHVFVEKSEMERALDALDEAKTLYEACVAIGENDACPDLFNVVMTRADLLERLERDEEAAALYDYAIDSFATLAETEELPLVEGVAHAFHRRAVLRKSPKTRKSLLSDLDHAIHLYLQVADSLIYSLSDEDEGCGCGHCGHDHSDHECGCGCEHDEHGCDCGCDHDAEDGCGCGCGGCGEHERRFLIDRWVSENYRDLMDAYYERIKAHMEDGNPKFAQDDCVAAMRLHAAYHKVLREDETLESDEYKSIRQIADSFGV